MSSTSALSIIKLYVRSVVYLRPTQITNRLRLLFIQTILHKQSVFKRWYLKQQSDNKSVVLLFFAEKKYSSRNTFDSISSGNFTFLNKSVHLGSSIDWAVETEDKLWRYNLHYFDYLKDIAYEYYKNQDQARYRLCRTLVIDWIENCPITMPTAWDTYPTSLRVTNWIKVYALLNVSSSNDEVFSEAFKRSIYVQTLYIEKHLEFDLQNNHLLENAGALFIAGHFFQCSVAKRWRNKGTKLLAMGLRDNFLADGGHEERSPMYHQIMMDLYDDVLSVVNQIGADILTELPEKLTDMHCWFNTILHPDGQIPLFNDCAFGIASLPDTSAKFSDSVKDGMTALTDSGYFVFRDSRMGNFLIFDAGPLGPDHQTAHGHCDTLSFELSISGKRFIVDSGVNTYHGEIDWRNYYRSTRAHNTVVLDREDQSEIWGRFRVARRAHPFDFCWSEGSRQDLVYVMASHDGYCRLQNPVVHRRAVCWINREFWIVCDHISGHGEHLVESLLHLHPNTKVQTTQPVENKFKVSIDEACLHITPWGGPKVTSYFGEKNPIQGWYAPEFGLNIENQVISFQHQSLPVWSGYILSPLEESYECEFESGIGAMGILKITTVTKEYKIMIGHDNIALEIRE